MSSRAIQFHKIWIEQCEATEGIRDHFGSKNALDYLIGEKLFHFVQAAEQHPEFATELPAFVEEIHRLFTAGQIREYRMNWRKLSILPHKSRIWTMRMRKSRKNSGWRIQ